MLFISEIKKIIIKISIRDLEFKIYYLDKYAILIFYMKSVLFNNTHVFAKIIREIHIIDDLKASIFIESNILTSKRIIINFAIQFIKIDNYRDIRISINSRARSELIKRTMKVFSRLILSSRST